MIEVIDNLKELVKGFPRGHLIHAAILSCVAAFLDEHHAYWFGCRREDWFKIALITPQQYSHAVKTLQDRRMIHTLRTAEAGTSVPIIYHALPSRGRKQELRQGNNTYVYTLG